MALLLVTVPPVLVEGKYFSEEQMRIREPLLYEQYIGQYLTDEEVRASCRVAHTASAPLSFLTNTLSFSPFASSLTPRLLPQIFERSQEAMQEHSAGASESGAPGLASLLLDTYQEQLIQSRLQEEQEREEGALEEEDDEEEESDGKRGRHLPSHPPVDAVPATHRTSLGSLRQMNQSSSSSRTRSPPPRRRRCSGRSSSARCTSASLTAKTRILTTGETTSSVFLDS